MSTVPNTQAERAAESLRAAIADWRPDGASKRLAWASMIPRILLDGALGGVDVDGHLVLVVPHQIPASELPLLKRELQQLSAKYAVADVALRDASAAVTLPTPGTFTLTLPLLGTIADYAELAGNLQRALFAIAEATEGAGA